MDNNTQIINETLEVAQQAPKIKKISTEAQKEYQKQ